MGQRTVIHFVDADTRMRAELARIAFGMGHHAEVYADLAELCDHPAHRGIVVIRDEAQEGEIESALDLLARCGVWLPLVGMSEDPPTSRVVAAIKAGAIDYLALPLDPDRFSAMLDRVGGEAREHAEARRRMIEARGRLSSLSAREREVLDWLTLGSSNKTIARELQISPRTVEIHRANMMTKLGASHAAEAVRLRLEARIDGPAIQALAG
ncbi:response regulator transcription factor [Tsuneonella sp. SYSU-LHT278]|uniref:response regulator transcription factor n=1 Tax=Tsuneonella sediminis TaxID=3416089 RepID=UPI003F798A19